MLVIYIDLTGLEMVPGAAKGGEDREEEVEMERESKVKEDSRRRGMDKENRKKMQKKKAE